MVLNTKILKTGPFRHFPVILKPVFFWVLAFPTVKNKDINTLWIFF